MCHLPLEPREWPPRPNPGQPGRASQGHGHLISGSAGGRQLRQGPTSRVQWPKLPELTAQKPLPFDLSECRVAAAGCSEAERVAAVLGLESLMRRFLLRDWICHC